MKAFITGSRAYGLPTLKSDIDLVLLVSKEVKSLLTKFSDKGKEPVRYGKLNLILCTTETEFALWKVGTETTIKHKKRINKPINKKEATLILDNLRLALGFPTQLNQSGGE